MSLQEQCEEILKNVDHTSFDSVEGAMEKMLDLIENNEKDPYIETAMKKTTELKDEARILLKNERENIKKIANENGISLAEIGIKNSDSDVNVKIDSEKNANSHEKIRNNTKDDENESEEEEDPEKEALKGPKKEGNCCLLI